MQHVRMENSVSFTTATTNLFNSQAFSNQNRMKYENTGTFDKIESKSSSLQGPNLRGTAVAGKENNVIPACHIDVKYIPYGQD